MHHPSVSWHIIPLKFYSWNITCFWQKQPIKVQFFRLLSALMEVHPISDATFAHGHKVRVYSNFASLFSVMKETLLYFFKLKPYILWTKRAHIEVKFSYFWAVGWKFTKFIMSYLKSQVSFSLNFASVFSVMRDSVLF